MSMSKLSVVVPCFNEERLLETIVERVLGADRCGLVLEVLIVEDGSSDLAAIEYGVSRGKSTALRTGFRLGTRPAISCSCRMRTWNTILKNIHGYSSRSSTGALMSCLA